MNITLDQARCFCALVDCGSYQAAAKEMNKSHSAVVYSIGCFERQSGLSLLNRHEYRTTLTPAGERVYQQCRSLLSEATKLGQLCSDLSGGWEPTVRLVYDGVLSPEPFLQIFKYFKDERIPTILDIYSDYLHGVEKSFAELEAQFMISIMPVKQSGLHSVDLPPLSNILVAHRDHALFTHEQPWTLNELKSFNFFTVRGADKSLNLGTKELEENSTFHLSDFSLKKIAILQGAGFGWLPQYLIQDELNLEILKPIHWEGSSFQALYPRLYYKKKNKIGRASQIILGKLR
ncbi:MAG: LysR family transcriptional regulator [Pseudobdellovibrionaceae bacterium]